jgi:hypothetical protein
VPQTSTSKRGRVVVERDAARSAIAVISARSAEARRRRGRAEDEAGARFGEGLVQLSLAVELRRDGRSEAAGGRRSA